MFNDWGLDDSTKESLIGFVTEELVRIIDENKGGWVTTTVHYKVRTEYSDESFYLNRVDGTYDESLHMLIHRIMYVENKHVVGSNDPDEDLNCYYQMFLDSEMMDEIEGDPHSRWWIDREHEDYEKIDEFLSDVYYDCIFNVLEYFEELDDCDINLRDDPDFKDYLDL